jgi:hypothetical protein
MLTQLTSHDHLTQWISDVKAAGLPGLSAFAKGLEQDLDAVTRGLTSRRNSGPVEGRVNHIKMIKRQMFGRAGLPLLCKRSCSISTSRHPQSELFNALPRVLKTGELALDRRGIVTRCPARIQFVLDDGHWTTGQNLRATGGLV